MRTRTLLWALLAFPTTACTTDPQGDDTGPGETGDSETDTTDEPDPLYPDGDRILLYHGHGAPEEDESGWARFEFVDTHWKDTYGWNSDYRSYIPDDLSDYRAIFFIAPGYQGEQAFTSDELSLLRGALDIGTRMVVLEEKDGCALLTPNDLLEGLGSSLRFTGSGLGDYQIAEMDQIADHQITTGVDTLRFRDACYLDFGDGEYLARYNDEILLAVDRPGAGGEVVVIGDFEFMDDSGPREWAKNGLLADRLVEIDPDLAVD